ncbi:PilZ domain-containing protein [Pseudoalteromonas mariniglutinosa]
MITEDKRNYRRMQLNTVAKLMPLEPASDTMLEVTCTDLSATGLAVKTSELLEVGSLYRVFIESSSTAINSFDARVRVVRASKEDDGTMSAGFEIIEFN